jgi:hypothetical protein
MTPEFTRRQLATGCLRSGPRGPLRKYRLQHTARAGLREPGFDVFRNFRITERFSPRFRGEATRDNVGRDGFNERQIRLGLRLRWKRVASNHEKRNGLAMIYPFLAEALRRS